MHEKREIEYKHQFCCDDIKELCKGLESDLVAYSRPQRFYALRLSILEKYQQISFCPWCGTKFNRDLRKEYAQLLKNDYGIEYPDDESELPKEFMSEEWFIKRKL